MKVKELIDELEKLNPEAECIHYDGYPIYGAQHVVLGLTENGTDIIESDKAEIY